MNPWKLYILRCADGTLYTGIAPDVERRVEKHNAGTGAKYTRGRGPVELVYSEVCGSRAAASRREWEVKAMSKAEKQQLIEAGSQTRKALLIHPQELSEKWIRRMKALGVDTLALHPVGGNQADETLEAMLQWLKTDAARKLLDYARSLGLRIQYEMHAGTWLLPRSLFEKQPELFRVDENGQRTTKRNFCVSNPATRRRVIRRAVELRDGLYASEDHYYFWMDDGKNLHCHCEKCKDYSASDQQLLMMNAIIRRLRKDDPKAKLAYLAYHDCMEPPRKVKPEKGIFLEYAPIERDFTKPVKENTDEKKLKELLDLFGRKDSRVLEYWYDNSLFSGWKKPPKEFTPHNELIPGDVEYYKSLGFQSVASFACYLGEDYEALYGEPDLSAFQE